jgi:hypothetical protein
MESSALFSGLRSSSSRFVVGMLFTWREKTYDVMQSALTVLSLLLWYLWHAAKWNTFWSENLKGRDHSEDLGVGGKIILEWILEKQDEKVWI